MADANSVSPGLATLGAGGWTVTEPSAGGRFGSVGVLTPQQTLATQALVSVDGNQPSATLAATTGTPGQIVRLSDGADAGALLVWAIPAGSSSYTWCWWLWPQSAY